MILNWPYGLRSSVGSLSAEYASLSRRAVTASGMACCGRSWSLALSGEQLR